jgi:hypothetical protein
MCSSRVVIFECCKMLKISRKTTQHSHLDISAKKGHPMTFLIIINFYLKLIEIASALNNQDSNLKILFEN